MKKVTVDDIMEREPCEGYPRERVEELWGGKNTLTLTEILNLGVPAADRIWATLQFLSNEENGQFARWCSLRVVHLWDCPDVVMQYLETGDEELRDAAWNAAWDAWDATAAAAAHSAAWNAAHAAALNAALNTALNAAWDAWGATTAAAAAHAAAWNAARGEEREKQIEKLKGIVECAK